MTNSAIYNFRRDGAWNSSFSFHYECAWQCFYEYKESINKLHAEEDSLRNSPDVEDEYLEGYIHHKTDHIHAQAYRAATSAHLYACMAIEGFINNYGTIRLGEDVFKSLLERTGITEKLSLIYLLCFEKVALISDHPIKSVRKIFDKRNALVHPKTKELTVHNISNYIYLHPSKLEIEETMNHLEEFISDICDMDKDILRDFSFTKPEQT
ncbi:Uncharacterised protein [Stutzerimonas stutzeri]|uniref:hypothetical protein n=1 Tax=Stutzerimonas stutzeri subgroup TaxID=578833 RepID=UPI000F71138B|nr:MULTISPECIES: hypothetical protein [Stutzerimonas stutzeri subgroup]MCQ2048655.1 hypothetical protein [Stutzerimonas kunmingensis]QQC11550.1 hypothetical protein I6I22_01720 [Stutzerimonas stutzeri]VEI29691.1 Uncharacterised protein [Stutzerimonas stutzeri]